jgi:hypothetical protein
MVIDRVVFGQPGGAIFSLPINNGIPTNIEVSKNQVDYQVFPNSFNYQAKLSFPTASDKANFTLYKANRLLLKTVYNITGG